MKILDKITLVLFSIIILIISLVMTLLMFGWIKFSSIGLLYSDLIASSAGTNTIIGVSAVCALLALRGIFFSGNAGQVGSGDGILLENDAGKLLISRDTIENLVNTVAKGFENTQDVTTRVYIDSNNELKVIVTLMVLPNTVINELSINLQTRIKEVVKKVADLDVKTIDIRIKNITAPEEQTLK